MSKGGALGPGSSQLHWRKSSHSGTAGNCVEVANLPNGGRAVRDSKNPTGLILILPAAAWAAFTDSVCSGDFD
ncbi:MAG: DUF397 domain-containing protein [Pseudonocardiaceae bacterium]